MKLVASSANQVTLSNVSETGEFRIRNSAKAFSILSSGLYANKIKAIIRELSCNAHDSHVAAGKNNVPFDVHLPTSLEPWFAIRDYGTGLNHDQVCNIYTTYFESTKTNSNDFIGALGLGSKSPFSYTDNFSVTAIKDGMKRIYSAFINGQGVPSIALLMEEPTTDSNGVEVKFSVEDRNDFYKFKEEAKDVYTFFKLKPILSGSSFEFSTINYVTENIVPGIHLTNEYQNSFAIMGNIAYPIHVPNATENLGDLKHLLDCGIHIEFDIGELDFQASREGLSYIPETIRSIKHKLEILDTNLERYLVDVMNLFDNEWKRADILLEYLRNPMWHSAIRSYISNTGFDLIEQYGPTLRARTFKIDVKTVESFNIKLKSFGIRAGYHNPIGTNTPTVTIHNDKIWNIGVKSNVNFVVNDTKIGVYERAANHFKARKEPVLVFVIDALDKSLPVDVDGFMKLLHNPLNVIQASELDKKPRKERITTAKLTSILKLVGQVWQPAGDLDDNTTYYYLPLSGYKLISQYNKDQYTNVLELVTKIQIALPELNVPVYGVRKQDMKTIQSLSNWINLEEHVISVISNLTDHDAILLQTTVVDSIRYLQYNASIDNLVDKSSPYSIFINKYKNISGTGSIEDVKRLISYYDIDSSITDKLSELGAEMQSVKERYPLLEHLRIWVVCPADIAQYINAIDNSI